MPLTDDVLGVLLCPKCNNPLAEQREGIGCNNGHQYPIRGGVIDLLLTPGDPRVRATLESFGYEWTRFARVEPEDAVFWKSYFMDVPLGEVADALTLDAGCGKGRFTRFTADHVRAVVAFDGSDAILSASTNLADRPNVTCIRGDLIDPPFTDSAFGFITCLGVLHHLPDPVSSLNRLVQLLRPGGYLLLYVYSRPDKLGVRAGGLAVAALLRRLTTFLPRPFLRIMCAPLAFLLALLFVIPGQIGERFHINGLKNLPLATYRRRPLRALWLDTFDRLSAPLEYRYSWPQLESILVDSGLNIEKFREQAGWFVLARRRPIAV